MNDLNFNIFNIVIFVGIVQGIIFSSIIFFHKRYKSRINNFIALTVLSLSLSNLQYWFMDVDLKGFFQIFNKFRIPFDFLIVPSFFLFVKSYLRNKVGYNLIFLLSIPFLIGLTSNFSLLSPNLFSYDTFITISIVLEVFSLLFNLSLIILIFKYILKYENEHKYYDSKDIKIKTYWLKQTLIIGMIMCLFWFAEIMYVKRENNIGLSVYYPLWISISVLIYWISYAGVFHSRLYNERTILRKLVYADGNSDPKNKAVKNVNAKLFEEIFLWIKESKIYLDPELELNYIAKQFDISSGYLSQLISAHSSLNFNEYINSLRIEEAKKMLMMKEYEKYTILAIGLESGFNSKSNFYNAFKKHTGKTPKEFKISPK